MRRRVFGGTAIVLACAALVFALVAAVPLIRYSEFTARGESMAPTIEVGSHLRTRTVDGSTIRDGDIVVLRVPADGPSAPRSLVVSRVVAVGGQAVSVRDGRVLLDGRRASEPYLATGATTRAFPTVTVPQHEVYVLGDNRLNSLGSNFYGPVPVRYVRGRVVDVDAPGTRELLVRIALGLAVALVAGFGAFRFRRSRRTPPAGWSDPVAEPRSP